MLKVGLTGGLATGKTFVGNALAERGCHILRADDVGHAVLVRGAEGYGRVVEAFGEGILNDDGEIDRKRLAAVVFQDDAKMRVLTSIVHPAVFAREEQWLQQVEDASPDAIAVVEAAILIEAGSYRRYQKVILAVCTEEQQIERAMSRDHASHEQVLERLLRQMPLEEKRKFADYVIDTSGTTDETIEQVRHLYKCLRSLNA
jgi:dephospho-CoA kinase